MKRNAFGQLISLHSHPFLRFTDGGGDGGGGDGKEFKAPDSQEALDKIVNSAVARTHKQYEGHDDFKSKAAKWDAHEAAEAAKNKPEPKPGDAPAGVSEQDVDKRINEALAAKDLELALERVGDRIDKALEGRTYPASVLLNLDRKQFVKDGKTVDSDAINEWVDKNSKASEVVPPKRRPIPGQGDRDANATGGSVQAGRDLYDETHKKRSGKD